MRWVKVPRTGMGSPRSTHYLQHNGDWPAPPQPDLGRREPAIPYSAFSTPNAPARRGYLQFYFLRMSGQTGFCSPTVPQALLGHLRSELKQVEGRRRFLKSPLRVCRSSDLPSFPSVPRGNPPETTFPTMLVASRSRRLQGFPLSLLGSSSLVSLGLHGGLWSYGKETCT